MVKLELAQIHVETALEALDIASAWHKKEKRFSNTSKEIRKQWKDTENV